ncbi:MAG TPA: DUF4190 domain-containing protein [Oscillospiraceae bacterium]|nr:DUF4190 domain-containing protein [Oscillospiraceae bacterium]
MDYPGKGKSIAAMVLGIIAIVFCWWGYFSIISLVLSIVGIVLAVGAKKELPPDAPKGMATAGLVLSIIALALSGIVFLSCVLCMSILGNAANEINEFNWNDYLN